MRRAPFARSSTRPASHSGPTVTNRSESPRRPQAGVGKLRRTRANIWGGLIDGTSYDLTARQYQPSIGQYLSPDPAANPGVGYQYGNGNPMSQIDPFGMSGSSWMNVTAGTTGGVAVTSAAPSYNCTNSSWCSQLSTGIAPMAETGGAVSGTSTDLSISAASYKGSSSASIVQGALGGTTSGSGLTSVGKTKPPKVDLGQTILAWSEIVGGIGIAASAMSFVAAGALEALAGIAGIPETGGLSAAAVIAGAAEAAIAAAFIAGGVTLVADGINRLQGRGWGQR